MLLTKEIAKAGRALLEWTQQDLADAAGLSIGTVSRFEAGTGMHDDNMDRLMKALQHGGIDFIIENRIIVGVKKLRKTKEKT